jgi:hypothetical protein
MMNSDDNLRGRLRDSEGRFTERKTKNVSTEDIRKTLVAFANSLQDEQEGVLFIGVSDRGDFLGVDNTDKMQKDIRRIAEEKCYPPIKVQFGVLKESGVEVVAVIVPFSKNKPHFAGPAYVRIGSESKAASQEMFEELITSRNDKARYILQYRDQDRVVLVALRHPNYRGAYLPRIRCKVVDCNPQYATFREEPAGGILSISLGSVSIKWVGQVEMPLITEEWN